MEVIDEITVMPGKTGEGKQVGNNLKKKGAPCISWRQSWAVFYAEVFPVICQNPNVS